MKRLEIKKPPINPARSLAAILTMIGMHTHAIAQIDEPLEVKVVIVTMFEVGDDTGDTPGEFQLWAEREHLNRRYPLPHSHHDIYANDQGVIGFVTGIGVTKAAASTMAVGLDPRFDLTKAYWVIAGISGIDPQDGSLGSAAWAEYIVDGGLAHEIDAREIPGDWTTGYTPLGSAIPYQLPAKGSNPNVTQVFELNKSLVAWAFQLTVHIELPDTPGMAKRRGDFINHSKASRPPFVLIGDNLADSTFWHGALMTKFGNDWVNFWTHGKGNFVTKAMEDVGTLQALTYLADSGKIDINRVLVLRTASNYTMQSPDMTANESLSKERGASFSAYHESLDTAYRVGSRVVHELVDNWEIWRDETPAARPLEKVHLLTINQSQSNEIIEKPQVSPQPDDSTVTETDRRHIRRTYNIARNAVAKGNHPFGALLERNGEIIMEIENAVVTSEDITKHAETRLIGEATKKFDRQTLAESTLYTSTEPCIMCCGAIYWAGVKRIVYGASAKQMTRVISGKKYIGYASKDIFARMAPKVEVTGPVDEEEGLAIHADFWPEFLARKKSE